MRAFTSIGPAVQEIVMACVNPGLESRVGLKPGYSVDGLQYAFFSPQRFED